MSQNRGLEAYGPLQQAERAGRQSAALVVLGLLAASVGGCGVDVRKQGGDDSAEVRVKAPGVDVDVETENARAYDLRAAGLNVYPGARRTSGDPDGDGASVTVRVPFYTMQMMAARLETPDSAEKVADFYRKELVKLGTVTESSEMPRTNIEKFRWKPGPNQTILSVDAGGRVYIAAMKPKDKGCTFALLYMDFTGQAKVGPKQPA